MTKLTVPGHPFQYAWVVPDMEAGIDYWANTVGVGPFFVNEVDCSTLDVFRYRGGEGELQMKVAWAQSKQGQIELIEVISKAPNVYRELIPEGKTGFHHIGIWTDDYQKDVDLISSQGFEMGMEMVTGSQICYFDTSAANGSMLEVIERGPGIVGLFDMIGVAADEWDGTKPMRTMAELMGG